MEELLATLEPGKAALVRRYVTGANRTTQQAGSSPGEPSAANGSFSDSDASSKDSLTGLSKSSDVHT